MTDTLCIAYARNSWWSSRKKWRHDGDEFVREANRFAALDEADGREVVLRQYTKKNKYSLRSQTLTDIDDYPGPELYAFFCHGSWKWIFGTGHHVWNVAELARAISLHGYMTTTIALYACSCGRCRTVLPWQKRRPVVERERIQGKDGVAHRLSAELGAMGARAKVFAHTTAGHTTRNPNLCMITTDPETLVTTTVYYKEYIIKELGKPGWKKFCNLMQNDNKLRFYIIEMTMQEVLDKIEGAMQG